METLAVVQSVTPAPWSPLIEITILIQSSNDWPSSVWRFCERYTAVIGITNLQHFAWSICMWQRWPQIRSARLITDSILSFFGPGSEVGVNNLWKTRPKSGVSFYFRHQESAWSLQITIIVAFRFHWWFAEFEQGSFSEICKDFGAGAVSGFKNFGTGAQSEYENITPTPLVSSSSSGKLRLFRLLLRLLW